MTPVDTRTRHASVKNLAFYAERLLKSMTYANREDFPQILGAAAKEKLFCKFLHNQTKTRRVRQISVIFIFHFILQSKQFAQSVCDVFLAHFVDVCVDVERLTAMNVQPCQLVQFLDR